MKDNNCIIDEMAKVIDEYTEPLSARDIHKADFSEQFAKHLYNAGYRKQSEVAREIFEEIEQVMSSLDRRYMASGNPKQSWGVRGAMAEIAELKKKYTGEEK